MKILQVTNFFKPSWEAGGPVRATYEISSSLVEKGDEVTVYTTDGFKYRLDVKKNKSVCVDGIKTYYFKNLSLYLSKKMNLPIPYFSPFIIKKNIKNFDAIHIHEYRTFFAVIVCYYAKKYGKPYILQPRGSLPLMGKERQKKVFDLLFGHSIIKNASIIIASSKHESNHYLEVFPYLKPEKIVHIPNGINTQSYQNLPLKGQFKKKYSIDENDKIVLFLGRIHEIKGLNILVEAFSDIKTDLKNVKLVIAGPDDGYLNKLKSIVNRLNVRDDVIFTGPLYEKDKIEAYLDADIFVLPSKYESFGNVVFEACACGTPVIVTNRCGISDYINSEVGYVVEYDKSQLANAIFKILSDDELRKKLSYNSKKVANYNYSWKEIASHLKQIYLEIE